MSTPVNSKPEPSAAERSAARSLAARPKLMRAWREYVDASIASMCDIGMNYVDIPQKRLPRFRNLHPHDEMQKELAAQLRMDGYDVIMYVDGSMVIKW